MKQEQFEEILNKRIDSIKETLQYKAKEYASSTDRLHNFKVAARVDKETPEEALWGMAKKHLVSIIDIKNYCGITVFPESMIKEKIGDMINYLILLEALLTERYGS